MHIIGNKNSSYELKIDYVTYVLQALKKNKDVVIGDIGIDIELIDSKIAIKNYRFSLEYKNNKEINPQIKNIDSRLIVVSNVIDGSPAFEKLIPGDIILKINDEEVGDNLILLDQILNRK